MGLSRKWAPRKDREKYITLALGLVSIAVPMFIPLLDWWVKLAISSLNSMIAIFLYIKIAASPLTIMTKLSAFLGYKSAPKRFVRGGAQVKAPKPPQIKTQRILGLLPSHAGMVGLILLVLFNVFAYFANGPLQEWLSGPAHTRAETLPYKTISFVPLSENDYQRISMRSRTPGILQVSNGITTWEYPVGEDKNIILTISSHQFSSANQITIKATFSHTETPGTENTLWLLPIENPSIEGRIVCTSINAAYFVGTNAQTREDITHIFSSICPTDNRGNTYEAKYTTNRPAWLVIDGDIDYAVAKVKELFENANILTENCCQ